MSSSSSYSDSSSELDSSSEELVSVGVEGGFTVPASSLRKLTNLSCTGLVPWLVPWLVPLYLLIAIFGSLGVFTLIFLVEIRAGVEVSTREDVNKTNNRSIIVLLNINKEKCKLTRYIQARNKLSATPRFTRMVFRKGIWQIVSMLPAPDRNKDLLKRSGTHSSGPELLG